MADASLVFSILGIDKASEVLGGVADKMGGLAKVAAGVGVAAAGALGVSFFTALDMDKSNDKLAAQLGLSESQSAEIGKIAGQLYAQNYGESLDEVNEAIKYVVQNGVAQLGDAAGIKEATAAAENLASTFDLDVAGSTETVAQLMKTGLVSSAQEAFDVITRGEQIGADKAGDLLDTFNEYPTQFRKLGLSAQDALGLIQQGLQGGARDSDLVADALKEFSIRAVDGSKTTVQGFQMIGLNAQTMAEMIGAGGDSAKAGLGKVLDGLRSIEDPVARSQAAVALFGTQAEDMGQSLLDLNPANAVAALGQVSGAAAQMGSTLSDNASSNIESFKRQATIAFVDILGGQVIPFFQKATTWLAANLGPALAVVSDKALAFGTYVRTTIVPAIADFGGWLQKYQGWLIPIAAGIGAIVVAMQIYKGVTAVITTATKIWAAAQAALNIVMSLNPIAIVVLAIVGLVAAFVVAYQRSETFRDIVNGVFGAVRDFVVSSIEIVKDVIMGVWNWISDNWKLLLAILTGPIGAAVLLIITYWDQIVGGFTAVKDWIFARVDDIAGFITGLPGRVAGAVSGMWEGIKGGATAARNWVTDRLQDIINFIGGVPGAIASTAAGMFDGIWQAFRSAINNVIRAWNNLSLGFDGFTVHIPLAPDISVPGFHIGTPDIPMLAKGGIVTGPTLAVLGDNPARKEAVIPLERAGQFGFGGNGATINITLDARETEQLLTLNKLRKTIRDQQGRGPNSVQMALGT